MIKKRRGLLRPLPGGAIEHPTRPHIYGPYELGLIYQPKTHQKIKNGALKAAATSASAFGCLLAGSRASDDGQRDSHARTADPGNPLSSSISWVELCCCHSNGPREADGEGGWWGCWMGGWVGVLSVFLWWLLVLLRSDLCPLPSITSLAPPPPARTLWSGGVMKPPPRSPSCRHHIFLFVQQQLDKCLSGMSHKCLSQFG